MTKIFTERLRLRLLQMSDLENVHELHSLPETDEFNALGIPENLEETKLIIETWMDEYQKTIGKRYTFVIETFENQGFIGLLGLTLGSPKYNKGEIWYKLHRDHWRQGFGTEAVCGILNFGFEHLKLHRMEAGCAIENIGSIKILEKVGMIREGRKRKILPLKNGWSDNYEYAILDSDERMICPSKIEIL